MPPLLRKIDRHSIRHTLTRKTEAPIPWQSARPARDTISSSDPEAARWQRLSYYFFETIGPLVVCFVGLHGAQGKGFGAAFLFYRLFSLRRSPFGLKAILAEALGRGMNALQCFTCF